MKSKRGFSLIEMLIVLALIAVAAMLTFSIFGQGFRLYAVESESADEQKNMRQVLSDITNKARLADPQSITYESGVLHVGDCSYTLESEKIKRNETVIADHIASFEVSISTSILEIETVKILDIDIVKTSGKSLSTSISLKDRGEK